MEKRIFSYLTKRGLLLYEEGDIATNYMNVSPETKEIKGNDVVLSGNRLGLVGLADYILDVALTGINGSHVHLDSFNFFDESEYQLIIELRESN